MRALLLVAVALVAMAPHATAPYTPSTPENLDAVYSTSQNTVQVTWQAPTQSGLSYLVWRDGQYLGSTTGTSFLDTFSSRPEPGYIYFVSAQWVDSSGTYVSPPAVDGVATTACEVVSVSTSWNYPYVYAHLHEECLGGTVTYDKDATWMRP